MAAVFEPHPEAAIPYHALTRAGTRQQGSACTAARFCSGALSLLSHTCTACLQSSTVTPGACRPSPAGMACCTMCPSCPPARSASRMHAQCHLSSPWYYTTTACTTHSCLHNDDTSTHALGGALVAAATTVAACHSAAVFGRARRCASGGHQLGAPTRQHGPHCGSTGMNAVYLTALPILPYTHAGLLCTDKSM